MKKNPTVKLKDKIKELERQLDYQSDYRGKFYDLQKDYKEKFEDRYSNLLKENHEGYQMNIQLIEIIRWLVNPESAMETKIVDKANEMLRKCG